MKLTGLITVEKIRDAINALYDSLPANPYPVGTIYMSTVSTSPATLFGGTWEALEQGRVLLSQGKNYAAGSTGGEATHTLSVNEIPPHGHSASVSNSSASHTHEVYVGTSGSSGSFDVITNGYHENSVYPNRKNSYTATTSSADGSHGHTVSIANTGGGAAHNNMQPYLAVYMWKRTA